MTSRPAASAWALGGLGIAIALLQALWAALVGLGSERGGAPAYWAADRDGGRVVALDAELYPVRSLDVPWPVALAPGRGGELWVLCALDGRRRGRHELRRVLPDDGSRTVLALEGPARLASDGTGGAWCAGSGAGRPLIRLEAAGGRRMLSLGAGVAQLAVGPGGVLVADGAGRVLVRGADGATRQCALAEAPCALAGDRAGAGWWVLGAGEPQRLLRLGPALEVRAAWETGLAARLMAPVAGGRAVWLVDDRAQVLARLERGHSVLRVACPDLAGAADALATPDGGLLVAVPGAVLAFGPRGERRPGQGGFRRLTGLVRVSPDPGSGR